MFCRFLEFYLVSAYCAVCAIGIVAINIAVQQAINTQREWGTCYAYGVAGHLFPRAP
jgi:hypothetical protein